MGAASRRKGAAGERELAARLSEQLGVVVRRKLGAARDGGDDLDLGLQIGALISVECKRCEQVRLAEWLAQAHANAGGRIAAVGHRKNGQDWMVILSLDDFCRLVREAL